MKTGIFLDLDGTLLTDKYTISDFDILQIKRLKELGYKFYIVTGKTYNGAIDFYKKLELDTPLIAYSGQVVYWPKNNGFSKEILPLKAKDVNQIINEIDSEYHVNNFMIALEKGVFYSKKQINSNLVTLIHKNDCVKDLSKIPTEYEAVGTYIEIENDSIRNLMDFTKKLNNKYKNKISFAFWRTDGNLPVIQFRPYEIDKGTAMNKVKAKEKIEKTIAFGNGWTDRVMIKKADLGYAMKNSAKKVKTYANYTTEFDNNNSGVGHELAKIKNKSTST